MAFKAVLNLAEERLFVKQARVRTGAGSILAKSEVVPAPQ